jgi:MoxR-like ATPase
LLKATREDPAVVNGLSPRAGLQWLAAARAAAYMEGRKMALPEDIQWLAQAVTAHRLKMRDGANAAEAVNKIIETVEVV